MTTPEQSRQDLHQELSPNSYGLPEQRNPKEARMDHSTSIDKFVELIEWNEITYKQSQIAKETGLTAYQAFCLTNNDCERSNKAKLGPEDTQKVKTFIREESDKLGRKVSAIVYDIRTIDLSAPELIQKVQHNSKESLQKSNLISYLKYISDRFPGQRNHSLQVSIVNYALENTLSIGQIKSIVEDTNGIFSADIANSSVKRREKKIKTPSPETQLSTETKPTVPQNESSAKRKRGRPKKIIVEKSQPERTERKSNKKDKPVLSAIDIQIRKNQLQIDKNNIKIETLTLKNDALRAENESLAKQNNPTPPESPRAILPLPGTIPRPEIVVRKEVKKTTTTPAVKNPDKPTTLEKLPLPSKVVGEMRAKCGELTDKKISLTASLKEFQSPDCSGFLAWTNYKRLHISIEEKGAIKGFSTPNPEFFINKEYTPSQCATFFKSVLKKGRFVFEGKTINDKHKSGCPLPKTSDYSTLNKSIQSLHSQNHYLISQIRGTLLKNKNHLSWLNDPVINLSESEKKFIAVIACLNIPYFVDHRDEIGNLDTVVSSIYTKMENFYQN